MLIHHECAVNHQMLFLYVKNLYYCKSKDADAVGEYSEEGFTVNKGSKSNIKELTSISTKC